MLGPRKNNLTVTRLRSVKPGPEDNYHFNDRTFYSAIYTETTFSTVLAIIKIIDGTFQLTAFRSGWLIFPVVISLL